MFSPNHIILGNINQGRDSDYKDGDKPALYLTSLLHQDKLSDKALDDIGSRFTKIHLPDQKDAHLGHALRKVTADIISYQNSIRDLDISESEIKKMFIAIIHGNAIKDNEVWKISKRTKNLEEINICTGSNFNRWSSNKFKTTGRSSVADLIIGFLRSSTELTKEKHLELLLKDKPENQNKFIKEFSGIKGYKKFSRLFCEGKMNKSVVLMSKILKTRFKELGWDAKIELSVKEFESVQEELLSDKFNEYKGIEGCKLFANKTICDGSMDKAYRVVSAVLKTINDSEKTLSSLGWDACIHLSVTEFESVQEELLSDKFNDYKGIEGYKLFSKKTICDDSMLKAYIVVSAVLKTINDPEKTLNSLGWDACITLSVKEFESVKEELLSDKFNEYKGIEGYKLFSKKDVCGGSMQKAYIVISAVLKNINDPEKTLKTLGWDAQINLSVKELESVRDELLSDKFNEYKGINGYKLFSKKAICDGSMTKAYLVVSAVLKTINDPEKTLKTLGWDACINLSVKEFESVQAELLSDNFDKYKGINGYKLFANKTICDGSMQKAYLVVSAVLKTISDPEKTLESLGWLGQIQLTTTQYSDLCNKIQNNFDQLKGVESQTKLSFQYEDISIQSMFKSMLATLKYMGLEHKINDLEWNKE